MASAKFREHSDKTLKNMGFTPTISDPRLYVKFYPDGTKAYISVHVDDLGIADSNKQLINEIKKELQKVYKLQFDTDFNYYLGMLIWRDRPNKIIKVSQPGYIADLLETYNVNTTHCPLTPMVDVPRPKPSPTNPVLDAAGINEYQSKVGSCLWLVNSTRPDGLQAINMLSRYTHTPTAFDMKAVDRVLQYIAGTAEYGLMFSSNEGVVLYATVDASYGNHEDRKSHSGCTLPLVVPQEPSYHEVRNSQ